MDDDAVHLPADHLAVLFADISDSSLLYAMRGDSVAFALSTKCIDVMIAEIRRAGGRVVKRIGDGLLATFKQADASVRAASGIQQALDDRSSVLSQEGLHVRIGISAGRAVLRDDDVFGDVVNVAARLETHAGPGEIVLSSAVYEALPADLRRWARLMDPVVLRGRPSLVSVYRYIWKQDDATATAELDVRRPVTTLLVTYGERQLVVDATRPKLRIGRATDNDISIDNNLVSRYHADIGLRGARFYLCDSSANGTYVEAEGSELVRVTREDFVLIGNGSIWPGSQKVVPIRYAVCLTP